MYVKFAEKIVLGEITSAEKWFIRNALILLSKAIKRWIANKKNYILHTKNCSIFINVHTSKIDIFALP